jgi:hypothetical protein
MFPKFMGISFVCRRKNEMGRNGARNNQTRTQGLILASTLSPMPSQPFIASAASLSLFLSVIFSYILDTVSSMNREKMPGQNFRARRLTLDLNEIIRWNIVLNDTVFAPSRSVAKAYLVSYTIRELFE